MRYTKADYDKLVEQLHLKGYCTGMLYRGNEDVTYWKPFDVTYEEEGNSDTRKIGYQIAIGVYDWSNHINNNSSAFTEEDRKYPFTTLFDFVLAHNVGCGRVDLTICSDEIDIDLFEKVCEEFYQKFCNGFIKENIKNQSHANR